jgi:hypothetical protein
MGGASGRTHGDVWHEMAVRSVMVSAIKMLKVLFRIVFTHPLRL